MSHLSITPVGPFGFAVAERLRDLVHDVSVVDAPDGVLSGKSGLNLLAAWRRTPQREREFDEESFRTGQPWLPVILDHPQLEVGPAIVPGHGACHGCYRRRIAQHDNARVIRAATGEYYDAHPEAGPDGFLPSTALLAAALAAEAVERLRTDPGAEAGRVRQIEVPTQQIRAGRTVGAHGCPRCGLGRDETTRSYERLPEMLQGVWR
ncbi:TOMM precursor leader peptide-binding protein [Actinoplanes sp. NPDC020271]|uniref:TOMM precursor leader peptide-binding protein n=1 Tax=Actinoplanes sp. NPDC020271 TaxID=3363896 RepID=UPI0037B11709